MATEACCHRISGPESVKDLGTLSEIPKNCSPVPQRCTVCELTCPPVHQQSDHHEPTLISMPQCDYYGYLPDYRVHLGMTEAYGTRRPFSTDLDPDSGFQHTFKIFEGVFGSELIGFLRACE